jgi:hypothetical protein
VEKTHPKNAGSFIKRGGKKSPEKNILFQITSAQICLHATGWRLHAGGGFTNARAGDKLPNSHKTVCGNTPPLA